MISGDEKLSSSGSESSTNDLKSSYVINISHGSTRFFLLSLVLGSKFLS